MKQRYELAVVRIERRQVRTFVQVALVARQGQIGLVVAAQVLASHDMLDLEHAVDRALRKAAILAAVPCALGDELTRGRRH